MSTATTAQEDRLICFCCLFHVLVLELEKCIFQIHFRKISQNANHTKEVLHMDYRRENEEVEIDLLALMRFLWSKAVLILLVTLVAAAVALVGSVVIGGSSEPQYVTSTSMYATLDENILASINTDATKVTFAQSEGFAETCIYILQSRTTLEEIIDEAGFSCSWSSLSSMITAEAVDDVYAFNVSVTGKSADDVLLIADAITKVLPERISEVIVGANLSIVDYPAVPTAESTAPDYLKNTALGAFVGLFLCAAVLAVKYIIDEQNDKTVRSADELRYLFPDIPVLTLIPVASSADNRSSYYSDKEANK